MQPVTTKKIVIPMEKRIICISDIHGELDLFKRLLKQINFSDADVLLLLGDLFTKGSQCHETLKFCIELCKQSNVFALIGNADWRCDYLSREELQWLDDLPHIIDAGTYVFTHTGLSENYFANPEAEPYVKYNNFMENAPKFEKWVVVGHWPVSMYCNKIPCVNPIVNEEKKIIAIDGGNVLKSDGQLNAFFIENDRFSFDYADNLPEYTVKKTHKAAGGNLFIKWLDRYIEIVESSSRLSRVKHLKTGTILTVPTSKIWTDNDGRLCCCDLATDYYIPCTAGDVVRLVEAFDDRLYIKHNGVTGWLRETINN